MNTDNLLGSENTIYKETLGKKTTSSPSTTNLTSGNSQFCCLVFEAHVYCLIFSV